MKILAINYTPERTFGAARSPEWPAVRADHLTRHPSCAACGSSVCLEVHHVKTFHLYPVLELEPTNLLTLCESPSAHCHLLVGHLLRWSSWNPSAARDAARWLAKILGRPNGMPVIHPTSTPLEIPVMDTDLETLTRERCMAAYKGAVGTAGVPVGFDPLIFVPIILAILQACVTKDATAIRLAAEHPSFQHRTAVQSAVRRELRRRYGVLGYQRHKGPSIVDAVLQAGKTATVDEVDRVLQAARS